jgi:hypothetical protein
VNIDPYTKKLTATKAETKRFTEARSLAELARRVESDGPDGAFWEGLGSDLKRAAMLVGQKHLNAQGYLQETPQQAAANAGVPG